MKRIFYLLFLFCISCQLQAQIDNNFWFVAPDVSSNHGDRPIYLRIATMADTANIVFRMPASLSFVPILQKINPNSGLMIDLTPWIDSIEDAPADKVLNRGLLLTSDKNITAYYEVANASNPAVSSFKGKNALGTEFYISGQTDYSNQTNDGSEVFDIVATEDNTHVQITPNLDIIGHAKGVTFEVTLNKGQTYSARTTNTAAPASLAGSHVVSDKPVAITLMDDSLYMVAGWDEIADQTIPVNMLGWDYIVIKGFANNSIGNNNEHVYILATKDNTDIFLDGNTVPVTNLNAGAQYDYAIPPANNTVKIKATNPVYVYHLSGNAAEAGSAIIPQDSCTGSRQIGFTRSTTNTFALLILTRNGNQGSFLVNGDNSIIQASDFSVVPGTGTSWVFCRKNNIPVGQIPQGVNQIVNTSGKFHLGILNMGSGGSSEYGYFSDFSSLYLGADRSLCPGDSLVLDGGADRTSYDWKKLVSGNWVTVDTNRFLVVHDSGAYAVMTDGDFCQLRDTIFIGLYPSPNANLGHDTTICEGASITLDPGVFLSYRWQNGSTGKSFTTSTAGIYWVEVTNNNGCKARDTIIIATDSLPKVAGSIAGLSPVCQGQNGVSFSVAPFPYATTYEWIPPAGATGASTSTSILLDFSVSATPDTLRVRGHNVCGTGPFLKLPVAVDPLPGPAGTITGPGSVCAGQNGIVYSVPAVANATSYTWSVPTGIAIVSGAGTNTVTLDFSFGAVAGNVTVKGHNYCGDGATASFPLTIFTPPVPVVSGPAGVCLNSVTNYSTAAGMTSYTWTVSAGGNIVSGAGTSSISVLWNTAAAKTITLNYNDANGCRAASPSTYDVFVNSLPVPVLNGVNIICPGNSAVYTSDAGKSNYLWLVSPGGTIISGGGNSDNTVTVSWNTAGMQTVSVNYTDGNGCTAASPAIFMVTVKPKPAVTNAANSTICSNSLTNIPLLASLPLTTFTWTASGSSGNVGGFSASAGPVISQILVNSGFNVETVTYSVTPSLNGCDGPIAQFVVTVNPVADVYFSPNGQTLCSGTNTGITLLSHVALSTYTWTASASSGNLGGFGPGNASPIAQPLTNTGTDPQTVTYNVSPSFNGCPGIPAAVVVTVNPLPSVLFPVCNDAITTTDAQPLKLKGGLPYGGTYSGTGVNTGFFYPSLAGPGNHTLTYNYINTWNCGASANHAINVTSPAPFSCGDNLTDPRDSKTYGTVKIGTQCWMSSNLDYGLVILSGQGQRDNCTVEKYCFGDNPANCASAGGLYTWDELMQFDNIPASQGICPPGWHIPAENEWNTLFIFYMNSGFAGSPLKYTGYSGFNALLDGSRFNNRSWSYQNFAGLLWSSSLHGPDKAWAHGMNSYNPSVSFYPSLRSNAFVVRCLKD